MKPTHSVDWRKAVEPYRLTAGAFGKLASRPGDTFGAFNIPHPAMADVFMFCILGNQVWDHVSLSLHYLHRGPLKRCPTWDEMCHIKDLFFTEEECVVQFHPPKKDYINCNPYVLHLWRPQHCTLPLPPKIFV